MNLSPTVVLSPHNQHTEQRLAADVLIPEVTCELKIHLSNHLILDTGESDEAVWDHLCSGHWTGLCLQAKSGDETKTTSIESAKKKEVKQF